MAQTPALLQYRCDLSPKGSDVGAGPEVDRVGDSVGGAALKLLGSSHETLPYSLTGISTGRARLVPLLEAGIRLSVLAHCP